MILHQDKDLSDGVNLFISILVRYPEIGTIRINPSHKTLQMNFMLSKIPAEKDMLAVKNLLCNSISTYYQLQGTNPETIHIMLNNYEKIATLTIERDIATLSKGELGLIILLLRDKFKNALIIDKNASLPDEDLKVQEDLIDNMLQNIQGQSYDKLIGIREDGRVLVFNK